jgi:hypothetical protein
MFWLPNRAEIWVHYATALRSADVRDRGIEDVAFPLSTAVQLGGSLFQVILYGLFKGCLSMCTRRDYEVSRAIPASFLSSAVWLALHLWGQDDIGSPG